MMAVLVITIGSRLYTKTWCSRLKAEEAAGQREALTVRLAYWAFRVDLAKAWSI
jgi:hypothetical protein